MFFVYSLYPNPSVPVQFGVNAYGPFATEQAAYAWIAAQQYANTFAVASAWNPIPSVPGGPLTPATLTLGCYIGVMLAISTIQGTFTTFGYGPYATLALAQAFTQQQPLQQQYTTAQIQAPP
jgi:hypothetical protein